MVNDAPAPRGVRGPPACVEVARQAFLFGQGDGVPVSSPRRLAEIAGVRVNTIYKWMPGWIKEREEMLVSRGNGVFGLSLSSETIEQHRKTTKFLEEQITEARNEIDALPKLHKFLEQALSAFVEAPDPKDYAQALQIFNAFHKTAACKKAAQTQLVMLQRAWKENAGIDSLQAVAEAREKAMATGRARLDLKREEAGGGGDSLPPAEVGSRDAVFDVGTDDGDPASEFG